MRATLAIELTATPDGSVVARGDLAVAPYWCRWDGVTLWIVGSAACPVGDDDITLDLRVGPGVTAEARTVAATVIYAARGEGTRLATRLQVAEQALLIWRPEPVIVTARARHRADLVIDVADGGASVVDEVVVFGRSKEAAGPYRSTTEIRRDGVPIALTSYDTGLPGWAGPGGAGGAKVVGSRLVLGAAVPDGLGADDRTAVLRPEGGGLIATTVADHPDQARDRLAAAVGWGGWGRPNRTRRTAQPATAAISFWYWRLPMTCRGPSPGPGARRRTP